MRLERPSPELEEKSKQQKRSGLAKATFDRIEKMGFVGAVIADKLISFGVTAFCIRALTKEEYVQFSLIFILTSLAFILVEHGNIAWLRTQYATGKSDFEASWALATRGTIIAFVCTIPPFLFGVLAFTENPSSTGVAAVIYLMAQAWMAYMSGMMLARADAANFFKFKVTVYLLGAAGFFCIVYSGIGISFIEARLLALIGAVFVVMLRYRNYLETARPNSDLQLSSPTNIERLKFVIPLTVLSVATTGALYMERLLLASSFDGDLVADILVSFGLIMPAASIADIVGKSKMTRFVGHMMNKRVQKLRYEQLQLVALIAMLSIGIYFFGYDVISLYAGPQYQTSRVAFLISVLACYPVIKAIQQQILRKFLYHEKTSTLMLIHATAALCYLWILQINVGRLDASLYVICFLGYCAASMAVSFLVGKRVLSH